MYASIPDRAEISDDMGRPRFRWPAGFTAPAGSSPARRRSGREPRRSSSFGLRSWQAPILTASPPHRRADLGRTGKIAQWSTLCRVPPFPRPGSTTYALWLPEDRSERVVVVPWCGLPQGEPRRLRPTGDSAPPSISPVTATPNARCCGGAVDNVRQWCGCSPPRMPSTSAEPLSKGIEPGRFFSPSPQQPPPRRSQE